MATDADFLKVAQQLKRELHGQAFIRKPRVELTELVREASDNSGYRLKKRGASDLELALLHQGVRVYPPLDETTTGDEVRLFHVNTVVSYLVDALHNPGEETDKQLAEVTKKVKGEWNGNK